MRRQGRKPARQVFRRHAEIGGQDPLFVRNGEAPFAALAALLPEQPVGQTFRSAAQFLILQFLDRAPVGACQFEYHRLHEIVILCQQLTNEVGGDHQDPGRRQGSGGLKTDVVVEHGGKYEQIYRPEYFNYRFVTSCRRRHFYQSVEDDVEKICWPILLEEYRSGRE